MSEFTEYAKTTSLVAPRPYTDSEFVGTWASILIVVVTLLWHSPALSTPPQEIARSVFPSTVLLVLHDKYGQPMSLGSGFVIQKNTVATNLHVIRGAASGVAKVVGRTDQLIVEGVLAVDEKLDLALLQVSLDAPSLPLFNGNVVEIGETIYAVGNPQGLEGTFSQGIVSGIRNVNGRRLLQITAPISPGSSGGPVLNDRGQVIGVAVATLRSGQNLNFAIASEGLSKLLLHKGALRTILKAAPSSTPLSTTIGGAPDQPRASSPKSRREGAPQDDGPTFRSAVAGYSFSWKEGDELFHEAHFGFSLKNNLGNRVADVMGIVIFYSKDGAPLHYQEFHYMWPIRARWAVRTSGRATSDIRNLTTRVEIRVLDYLNYEDKGICEFWSRFAAKNKYDDKTTSKVCRSSAEWGTSVEECEEKCSSTLR